MSISCSSSFIGEEPIPPRKQFSIREQSTYLPRTYIEVLDSTDVSIDYIDRTLSIQLPDTYPDSTLYNINDPIFPPLALDSGILLCNRDMALYIKDRENAKYLYKEIQSRKKLQLEFIHASVKAENMYQETINEANAYNIELYERIHNERSKQKTWRNVFLVFSAFAAGFVLNDVVD